MRMFEEEQRVANPAGAPVLDKRSLKRQRIGVRHAAQPADAERSPVFPHPLFQLFAPGQPC
jgi:hypothetical protein